ncbi:MAG: hypothetical protein FWF08_02710 [Oscillospiraceae bacterium]|nr:hypothetical protein [Oscillospiraceae bacterium]
MKKENRRKIIVTKGRIRSKIKSCPNRGIAATFLPTSLSKGTGGSSISLASPFVIKKIPFLSLNPSRISTTRCVIKASEPVLNVIMSPTMIFSGFSAFTMIMSPLLKPPEGPPGCGSMLDESTAYMRYPIKAFCEFFAVTNKKDALKVNMQKATNNKTRKNSPRFALLFFALG